MDEVLTLEHFTPHVGKIARFKGTPHAFPIDRVEQEGTVPPPGLLRLPFTVIFRGPRVREVLPEGLYDCEIDDGPVFSLYVMPIHTPQPDRQEYQASFN
ncbi:MAG: hypothetical protein WDN08_02865 [Rhizomicrobium sp.]